MSVSRNPESGELEEAGIASVVDGGGPPKRTAVGLAVISEPIDAVVGGMEDDVPGPDGFQVLYHHWVREQFLSLQTH